MARNPSGALAIFISRKVGRSDLTGHGALQMMRLQSSE